MLSRGRCPVDVAPWMLCDVVLWTLSCGCYVMLSRGRCPVDVAREPHILRASPPACPSVRLASRCDATCRRRSDPSSARRCGRTPLAVRRTVSSSRRFAIPSVRAGGPTASLSSPPSSAPVDVTRVITPQQPSRYYGNQSHNTTAAAALLWQPESHTTAAAALLRQPESHTTAAAALLRQPES